MDGWISGYLKRRRCGILFDSSEAMEEMERFVFMRNKQVIRWTLESSDVYTVYIVHTTQKYDSYMGQKCSCHSTID